MLAAPLIAVIMHMAVIRKVMDKFTIPMYLRVIGWTATAVMFGVSIGVFVTWK
jgi:Mn2+/Fe2+ NRAMP family transporter